MSATLQFDEDASRRVERIYTTPDVIQQRQAILRALALQPGERVIDIGSGPGLLACEMAAAVGTGGRICGVDVSENMLALARARRPPAGSGTVEYQEAGAPTLPYADASFDVAVCTQVYEYVDDVPAALLELRRVLRPGGRALVRDIEPAPPVARDWAGIATPGTRNGRHRRPRRRRSWLVISQASGPSLTSGRACLGATATGPLRAGGDITLAIALASET